MGNNKSTNYKKDKFSSCNSSYIKHGMGIDVGGTHTDVVIFDFENNLLLAKSKAQTTPWDFTIGIKNALQEINKEYLKSVELVTVSTTLATNAIVEGKGQNVGLIIMPPYNLFEPSDIPHDPIRIIKGRLDIDGSEIEPIDTEQVRKIGKELIENYGVDAFAVSGYASTINPEHEMLVKDILHRETGLFVSCGHELSELLNFKTRATTAVLNARIIPQVKRFINDLKNTLNELNLNAPIAIVKGDGSLVSIGMALERPVEIIHSGSASSISGARHLTNFDDAIVIDIGGTSTDIGLIKNGTIKECSDGTLVGGRKTHVQAIDVTTIGLGADSYIKVVDGEIEIGPVHVSPISWIGSLHDGVRYAIDYVEKNFEFYKNSTEPIQIIALTQCRDKLRLTIREKMIIEALKSRPHTIDELAEITEVKNWHLVPLLRLEKANIIQRCGLTPTDLIHIKEKFDKTGKKIACRLSEMYSTLGGFSSRDDFIKYVFNTIARIIATEIIYKLLDYEMPRNINFRKSSSIQKTMEMWLNRESTTMDVSFHLKYPVIGVGAPIKYFLPKISSYINTKYIIPDNTDVASAIGAITSKIVISKHVRIHPTKKNEFIIEGLSGRRVFFSLDEANNYAINKLVDIVRSMGVKAGTSEKKVDININDLQINFSDNDYFLNDTIFVERTISAVLKGLPDISKLKDNDKY